MAAASSASAADDLLPPPSLPTAADDESSSSSKISSSSRTQAFAFSSGNPRIEETRGLVHLFTQDPSDGSSSGLPSGRKPLLCVLGVPNHMTYADFCQFCGSFIHNVLEMRIVRKDGIEDRYSILMRFDNQDSADSFYKHFNGRQFSSLEEETCYMLFTEDVQYTGSVEHTQPSPTSSTEYATCAVCLERLDQDASGILTTICNHSFHCSCISLWTDSSCPVCRYCQQQPEKSICFICQTSENLWICLICGFVGCGRYKEGHAIRHWKETQHCYSLEVETQRVWDYVGDNYVHRLIQSKTDGKLVALNSRCSHVDDGCGSCDCSADNDISEVLLNSKVEAIVDEYNVLLCTQLENQKLYYEGLLQEIKDETDKEISEAVGKAVTLKLQKMQAKLDKCVEEKKFLDQINESLVKNQELWKERLQKIEERQRKAFQIKDDKIRQLEEQLQDLMGHIEVGNTIDQHPLSNDIKEGTVLSIQAEMSSGNRRSSQRDMPSSSQATVDPNMDVDDFVNPRPIDTSLLTMQSVHRTEAIWRNQMDRELKSDKPLRVAGHNVVSLNPQLTRGGYHYILNGGEATCSHAIAACKFARLEFSNFVPHEYTLQAYNVTWSYHFSPLPHADFWEPYVRLPHRPNPHFKRTKVGRNPTRRRHNEMDQRDVSQSSTQGEASSSQPLEEFKDANYASKLAITGGLVHSTMRAKPNI
ncbi:unnamed protein product [Rhodiola kirilowii]